jgi:hypothetical protein
MSTPEAIARLGLLMASTPFGGGAGRIALFRVSILGISAGDELFCSRLQRVRLPAALWA